MWDCTVSMSGLGLWCNQGGASNMCLLLPRGTGCMS